MDLGGLEGADEDLSPMPMPPSGFMSSSNSGNGLQERGEKLKVIYPNAGGAVATGAAVPGASNTHISGRIGSDNSSGKGNNTNNNIINSNSSSNNHTSNGTVGNGSNGLAGANISTNGPSVDEVRIPSSLELKGRKPVKYRECLKNHAASLGGYAVDGCGEFMPSGEEGTLEALRCAACTCHRNFHRREPDGESLPCECRSHYGVGSHSYDRKRIETLFPSPPPHAPLALPPPPLLHAHGGIGVGGSGIGMPPPPPPQMIMAFNPSVGTDSDEFDGGLVSPQSPLKKRFRTKFTLEQKEQMFEFAEKLGWRIQKHDEEAVQQFCMDVGVKRHVLKVWMHNNKHTLGKKLTAAPEEEVEAS